MRIFEYEIVLGWLQLIDVQLGVPMVYSFRPLWVTSLILSLLIAFPALAADGDPKRGEKLWRKCSSCHSVGPGARKMVGPHLNDLFGRTVGSNEEYFYSKAMKEAGLGGLAWDEVSIDAFLERPKSFMQNTRMSFAGMRSEQQRADIIAFLKQFSGETDDAVLAEHLQKQDPELPADVLALVGDPDYGEYLSSTCVGCHQLNGQDQGIPSIVGWPKEVFMTVMFSYRSRFRENAVMRQVAGSLNNEEIAALGVYFEKQ